MLHPTRLARLLLRAFPFVLVKVQRSEKRPLLQASIFTRRCVVACHASHCVPFFSTLKHLHPQTHTSTRTHDNTMGKKAKAPFVPKGRCLYEVRECAGKQVAIVTLDNAPMNPLSSGVRMGLDEHLKTATADERVDAIVLTGANGAFCAGADISEFSAGMRGPNLVKVINAYEASAKPVVAAIDGVALGGGCELTLAAHYRVATAQSRLGLPEVNLGLLPGAGGTQRMPRLVGAERAADLMCTGAPLSAKQALGLGVLDSIVDGNVVVAAVQLAAKVCGVDLATRRLCSRPATATDAQLAALSKKWGKLRAGETAPQAIIRCVAAARQADFFAGLAVEQKEFMPLMTGNQSKAMQYMFFAERACWKVPGLTAKPKTLQTIGIVGAGQMGCGIAQACAKGGYKVVMIDNDAALAEKRLEGIRKELAGRVKKGKLTEAKAKALGGAITCGGSDFAALKDCDMVIEAVFENMAVKKEVFAKLDAVCKAGAVLASNTSYLSIDEIAAATRRPEDVVGVHFFVPAHVMKFLENVAGAKTSPQTVATTMAFGKKIGKIAILCNTCDGFVANRMMAFQGSVQLQKAGVSPHVVDAAALKFGMRIGPFVMSDMVGLDLFSREAERTGKLDTENNLMHFLYSKGCHGMKNGRGYYVHAKGQAPVPNPLVAEFEQRKGTVAPKLSDEEIARRLYFPVINEGFNVLSEGIVSKVSDIDIALVYGYNFPRFSGGPMKVCLLAFCCCLRVLTHTHTVRGADRA